MPEQPREEHSDPSDASPGAEMEHVRRAQPPVDPEQLRQFQQFQQFQEFQRFSEAQKQAGAAELAEHQQPLPQPSPPPPPQPPPNWLPVAAPPPPEPAKIRAPRWLKKLGGKILSAILLLIVLAIAGKLLFNQFFPTADEDLPAPEAGRGTYSATELLQPNPYRAVQLVYQQIAQNRADLACGNFAKEAQAKFAADLGFADCAQAVAGLSPEVKNKTQYAQSIPFNRSGELPGDRVEIDSCDYRIEGGGRALGKFVVERQRTDASGGAVKGEQWLIVGHEPGPSPCPATPSPQPSN